jgi:hypothetical protein
MNRKSTSPIPEPIVQLQRQLDQFRSTQQRPSPAATSLLFCILIRLTIRGECGAWLLQCALSSIRLSSASPGRSQTRSCHESAQRIRVKRLERSIAQCRRISGRLTAEPQHRERDRL